MNAGGKLLMIGKGVTYRDLPCATALNRCESERMPFDWTINPYRGCEFGCRYCYARYTHGFMGLEDTRLFETEIFAKLDAAAALTDDLRRAARRAGPLGGIALGTATDPYQPAERKLLVTRRLLEVFASDRAPRGLRLSLTTKSALVTRDIDLLAAIGRRHRLSVNMTITTLNRRLARVLEPRAPRPARRLLALRELARAGITTGVFIMPVIPEITDAPASLEAIVSAAARAGAAYVMHQVLFLMSSATKEFYPFLRRHFPRLLPHYRRVYGASAYHTQEYRRCIDDLVESLRRRHGLAARPTAGRGLEAEPFPPGTPAQLSLGF